MQVQVSMPAAARHRHAFKGPNLVPHYPQGRLRAGCGWHEQQQQLRAGVSAVAAELRRPLCIAAIWLRSSPQGLVQAWASCWLHPGATVRGYAGSNAEYVGQAQPVQQAACVGKVYALPAHVLFK